MLRLRTLACVAAAAALPVMLLGSAAALAPNLLSNGDFSAGTTGWAVWAGIPGSVTANPDQTISVTNLSAPNVTTMAAAIQCLNTVTPGVAYTLKGDTYIPSGQQRHGGAQTRLFWYNGPNCTGATVSTPFGADFVTKQDQWVTVKTTFVAPGAAKSVMVMLATEQYSVEPSENPAAHFVSRWDNVSFTAPEVVLAEPPILPVTTSTPTPTPTTPTHYPTIVIPGAIPTSTTATASPTAPQGTATPAPATPSPTVQVTQEPIVPATSTATVTTTPAATTPVGTATDAAQAPLPPSTGSGPFGGGSDLPAFEIALSAIALVAAGGIIITLMGMRARE